jgi:hypothetical protein
MQTDGIRSMEDLASALFCVVLDRGLSCDDLAELSGLPRYWLERFFVRTASCRHWRNIGPLMQALGVQLLLVDDPEQIERVRGRWRPRTMRGAAVIQARAMQAVQV